MATGLLVVLVGPAARLAPYLTSAEKTYDARVVFGFETDTDDADGRMTASAAVPEEVGDPFFAAGTVASLVGTHEQIPPAYSAIKRGGKVAYEAARAGETLVLEPRTIAIASARLLGVDCQREMAWDVEFSVSKGTYIRALARDLGRALGTAAHLGALRRTRSGGMNVGNASTLAQIEAAADVSDLFADPISALGIPALELSEQDALRVRNGAALDVGASGGGEFPQGDNVGLTHDGVLLGVYARDAGILRPHVIIAGGVGGVR
jgi:tRNA pseudouridine55 synthase